MMEQSQDNTQASAAVANDAQDEAAPVSVGRQLREARERLGWSVDDVVNQIKLAPRQVHALEADDFESLPEVAFVRGFVRSYAKALKLDPQPLLDALPGSKSASVKQEGVGKVDVPFPIETSQSTQNMRLLVAALVVAVVITGFAAWQAHAPQTAPEDEVATTEMPVQLPEQVEVVPASGVPASGVEAASAVPEAASAVEAAPVAASPVADNKVTAKANPVAEGKVNAQSGALRLVFDKDSWAEIKDKSGKVRAKGLYKSGQELNLDGEAPFMLLVGHASSAHLYYRGKQVDLAPHISASSDVARLTLE